MTYEEKIETLLPVFEKHLRHLKGMFMRWREDDGTKDGQLAENTA